MCGKITAMAMISNEMGRGMEWISQMHTFDINQFQHELNTNHR